MYVVLNEAKTFFIDEIMRICSSIKSVERWRKVIQLSNTIFVRLIPYIECVRYKFY